MATKKVTDQELEAIEGEIVSNEVDDTKKLPANVFTLSSGVNVTFKVLPQQIAQKALSMVAGTVNTGTANVNMAAFGKITKYFDMVIMFGVKLYGNIEDYATPQQLAELNALFDGELMEYNYLRTFGFVSDDDFALVTEKVFQQ